MAWALASVLLLGAGLADAASSDTRAAAFTLFVHPTSGVDDEHSGGTEGQPLRSLAAAQLRLRAALQASPLLQATVHLLPGQHAAPPGGLRLTADDSSGAGGGVRWLGDREASISGGVPLSGWQPAPDESGLPSNVWVAPAPAGLPAGFVGRHLTVDGKRAPRTRRFVEALLADLELQAAGPAYTAVGQIPWSNRGANAELVYSAGGGSTWAEPRCAIEEIQWLADQNRSVLKMMQPCFLNMVRRGWNPRGNNVSCASYGPKSKAWPTGIVANCTLPRFVENVKQHLEPGQFFHDASSQRVYYVPIAGQDMAHATAVLAVEEQPVQLSGATGHTFDGIAFEHATWLRPGRGPGYVEAQAATCDLCPTGSQGCASPDYAADYE